jgi:hypothetical protein
VSSLEISFGGGSGIPSSSVSENDDDEDANAFAGEYSGDAGLFDDGGDGGLCGGS